MKGVRRRFTVEGLNLERLIRQAGEAGIPLTAMMRRGRKIRGAAEEDELPRLQQLADKGGWRLTVGGRIGAGRVVDMLRRRVTLAALCVLVAAGMTAASQLMWRVELVDAGVYEADMRQYLDERGVSPVCWKASVDPSDLRDDLEWRYPQAAWVEVGWRGTTLQITVVAGTPVGDTVTVDGSGDVVASRDGIIDRVMTVAGTPQVKSGDLVREGQVLIAGEERTSGGETRPVAARGVVMARVWDAAAVRMSVMERETVYTGRTLQVQNVSLPWFDLWTCAPSGYEQEDVAVRTMPLGGLFLPLILRWETHMEASVSVQPREIELLKAEAAVAALHKLRQKTGVADDFVDKWVDYSMIEGEILDAVAYGERIVDIARPLRHGEP
ncbi:MAG: sporulation protein YqfD [Aristaeellaceae bacterium]